MNLGPLSYGGICIQGAPLDADIHLYVRTCLSQESALRRLPDSVKGEVEEALVTKAQGM